MLSFKLSPEKLKDLSAAKLRVTGKYADGKPYSAEISATATDVQSSPQLWAKTVVVDLEDKYRLASGQSQEKLKNQIVSISVAHSLLTKFTAFVVVDHAEIVNKDGAVRKLVQPVEQPAAWAADLAQSAQAIPASGSWGAAQMQPLLAPMPMPQAPPQPSGVPASPMMGSGGTYGGTQSFDTRAQRKSAFQDESVDSWGASSSGAGWGSPPPSIGRAPGNQPPGSEQPQAPSSQPQPGGSPANQRGGKNVFQAFSDAAIDKLFGQNLGLSEQESKALKKDASAPSSAPANSAGGQPAGPTKLSQPAAPPAGAGGTGGWENFNASPPASPSDSHLPSSGWSPGAEQEMKTLQESFSKFEQALNAVLESLSRGEVPASAQLELARGALLTALANSSAAVKLPLLQKYLRADILHLIAALSAAASVGQKLKDLADSHEQKFVENLRGGFAANKRRKQTVLGVNGLMGTATNRAKQDKITRI